MTTDKLTTAEMYAQRNRRRRQRQAKIARRMLLFGGLCLTLGIGIYFSPISQAAEEEAKEIDFVDGEASSLATASAEEYAYFTGDANSPDTYLLDDGFTSFDLDTLPLQGDNGSSFQSMSDEYLAERSQDALSEELEDGTYNDGRLVVTMAPGTKDEEIDALLSSTGCYVLDRLSDGDEFSGATLVLSVGDESDVRQAQSKILSHATVISCLPDYIMTMTTEFDTSEPAGDSGVVESWYDESNNEFVSYDGIDAESDQPDEEAEGTGRESFYDDGGNLVTYVEETPSDDEGADDTSETDGAGFEAEEDFFIAGDPEDSSRWDYKELQYEKAWKSSKTNKKLTVAVIDNCFNVNAKDLRNLIVDKYNATGKNRTMKAPTTGEGSHGTHVAGIVAAEAGNHLGTSGISHNASLMLLQAGSSKPGNDSSVDLSGLIEALDYVARNADGKALGIPPVRVVNMSLGAEVSNKGAIANFKSVFKPRFDALNKKGVLVVTAAGNFGSNSANKCVFPACMSQSCPNVISVINIDRNLKRNPTSNWNPSGLSKNNYYYQISAPGTDIKSVFAALNGKPHNSVIGTMTGTSQAAPQVAGTAALMFAAKSSLTPLQARNLICSTAKDLGTKGADIEYGYGEVNPVKALQNLSKARNSNNKAAEEAKKKAEEEAKKKAAEEAKKKAEEEAKKKAAEEAKKQAEEEAKRKAAEEAKKKAAEEAKKKAEEEAKKKAAEDKNKANENKQKATEDDNKANEDKKKEDPTKKETDTTPTDKDTPDESKEDKNAPQAPVADKLPHAKIPYDWTDRKSETPKRYHLSFRYLDVLPTNKTGEGTSDKIDPGVEFDDGASTNDLTATAMTHVTKMPGKTFPMQSTVTEFFDGVLPSSDTIANGSVAFPSEIIDETTGEKWTVELDSSSMGEDKTLPGTVDGTVQYRTCRFALTNQTTGGVAHLNHVFWIADSEVAQTGDAVGATTLPDLVQSAIWSNDPIVLRASDGQPIGADSSGNSPLELTTDSAAVAEQGIVSVDAPFRLADGGCVAKEKNIGKIVGDGGDTHKIDEYAYQVTIMHPEATITPLQADKAATADAASPFTLTLDIVIRTTTSSEKTEDIRDVTNTPIPQPTAPSDPFEALKALECWIGGRLYSEFSYDRFDYTVQISAGNEFPSAPEIKGIPTDSGWKIDATASSGIVDQDGQMHRITLTNSNTRMAREYTFSYIRKKSEDPISQFFNNPSDSTSEASGGESEERRKLAVTGGTLAQTGDAVLIIGGAIIVVASGGWLLVYGRTRENQA